MYVVVQAQPTDEPFPTPVLIEGSGRLADEVRDGAGKSTAVVKVFGALW